MFTKRKIILTLCFITVTLTSLSDSNTQHALSMSQTKEKTDTVRVLRPQTVVVIPGMENRSTVITGSLGGFKAVDGNKVLVDYYQQASDKSWDFYLHFGHDNQGIDHFNQGVDLNAFYFNTHYGKWGIKGYNISSTSYIPNASNRNIGYSVLENDSDFYLTYAIINREDTSSEIGINYSAAHTKNNDIPGDPYIAQWFCTSAYVQGYINNSYSDITWSKTSTLHHQISWNSSISNDSSMKNYTSLIRSNVADSIHFDHAKNTVLNATIGLEYANANLKSQVNSQLVTSINQKLSPHFGVTAQIEQNSFNQALKNYIVSFPFDYYITPYNFNTRERDFSVGSGVYYQGDNYRVSVNIDNHLAMDKIVYYAESLGGIVTPIFLSNYGSAVNWNSYTVSGNYQLNSALSVQGNYQYSTLQNISYEPKNFSTVAISYTVDRNLLSTSMNYFEGMYSKLNNQGALNPILTLNVSDRYALSAADTVEIGVKNILNTTPIYKEGYYINGRQYSVAFQHQF